MAKLTFIEPNGKTHQYDVEDGQSGMEIAVQNDLPGLACECGGALACATCHVYVEKNWLDKLEPATDMERDMLDFAPDLKPTSRLCCQIKMSDELDGLILHIPQITD